MGEARQRHRRDASVENRVQHRGQCLRSMKQDRCCHSARTNTERQAAVETIPLHFLAAVKARQRRESRAHTAAARHGRASSQRMSARPCFRPRLHPHIPVSPCHDGTCAVAGRVASRVSMVRLSPDFGRLFLALEEPRRELASGTSDWLCLPSCT